MPNLLLIGLRASGKSTVGRLLAEHLRRGFIDLDALTAAELGAPSAGMALADNGEPRFREAEAACLGRALEVPGQVVALGGGTPMGDAARALIEAAKAAGGARVFYLAAPTTELRRRLAADPTLRPPLLGGSASAEVDRLFEMRDPIYRGLADHVIEAGADAPEVIAARIAGLAR